MLQVCKSWKFELVVNNITAASLNVPLDNALIPKINWKLREYECQSVAHHFGFTHSFSRERNYALKTLKIRRPFNPKFVSYSDYPEGLAWVRYLFFRPIIKQGDDPYSWKHAG